MTQAQLDIVCSVSYLHLLTGQRQSAVGLLSLARQSHPDEPGVLRLLALALVESGEGERALEVIADLERCEPDDEAGTLILLLRSRALHASARRAEARLCFDQYVSRRAGRAQ